VTISLDHVMEYGRSHVYLQWTPVFDNGPTYTSFIVERSALHGVDFVPIATVTDPFYIDRMDSDEAEEEGLTIFSETRQLVYRVRGIRDTANPAVREVLSNELDTNGLSTATFNDVPGVGFVPVLDGGTDVDTNSGSFFDNPETQKRQHHLYTAKLRRVFTALRILNGCEVLLVKRRRFGTKCSACVDSRTGQIVFTHCKSCYGTTWVGGYHTPVRTIAKISAAAASSQVIDLSKITTRSAEIRTLPTPSLEPDDLIVDVTNDTRWLVRRVDEHFFRKKNTSQDIIAQALARSSVEYTIPLQQYGSYVLEF